MARSVASVGCMKAIIVGGSVVPGCIIAEAIVLFVLAVLMIVAYRYGMFR